MEYPNYVNRANEAANQVATYLSAPNKTPLTPVLVAPVNSGPVKPTLTPTISPPPSTPGRYPTDPLDIREDVIVDTPIYNPNYIPPNTFAPSGYSAGQPLPVPNVIPPPIIITTPVKQTTPTPASLDFLKPSAKVVKNVVLPMVTPVVKEGEDGIGKYLTKKNLILGGVALLGLKLLKII